MKTTFLYLNILEEFKNSYTLCKFIERPTIKLPIETGWWIDTDRTCQ